ncbi:hypothetical protein ABZ362_18945 [Streptomyces sp. NPDC005951]|uniref:hypothetical protein n=1 Tax=Streptomyces sp. NPDC005951 TaxID=3154573 RepID=UPI0033E3833C
MTLKVYEVNRTGTVRVLREEAEVMPFERPEVSHEFPACECFTMRRRRIVKTTALGDTAYKAWLGHTQFCAACRAGVCCPTAVRLGRAWREARRG